MQRAGLYAFGPPLAQPRQMAVRIAELEIAQLRLLLDQRARNPHVLIEEHTESKLQVLDDALVEGLTLACALGWVLVLALDLLVCEFHQILIDDVADVFEVDGKGDDFGGAAAIAIVQAAAGNLGNIEFDHLVQSIDDVVHSWNFSGERLG